MQLDAFFPPELNAYVEAMTAQELPLLAQLRETTRKETQGAQMLSGPVEGALLQLLVSLSQAKTAVEVGTFTGYGALNIAKALPKDGKLYTLDMDERCAPIAQKYFDRSPDGHKITLMMGQAAESLKKIEGPLDFAFIDADKRNYPLYFDLIFPKLRSGGLIVVDNALWGGEVVDPKDPQTQAIHALNQKAKAEPLADTLMLTVRDGVLVIRKH